MRALLIASLLCCSMSFAESKAPPLAAKAPNAAAEHPDKISDLDQARVQIASMASASARLEAENAQLRARAAELRQQLIDVSTDSLKADLRTRYHLAEADGIGDNGEIKRAPKAPDKPKTAQAGPKK